MCEHLGGYLLIPSPANGPGDNTLIVYMTDHGPLFGDARAGGQPGGQLGNML